MITTAPPFHNPPQLAYGFFVDSPPPRGPYFWPCLPQFGYNLVNATAASEPASTSADSASGNVLSARSLSGSGVSPAPSGGAVGGNGSASAAAAPASASTPSQITTPFNLSQPPQITFGWFVPHPPPIGPYFWSALPPGYQLTRIEEEGDARGSKPPGSPHARPTAVPVFSAALAAANHGLSAVVGADRSLFGRASSDAFLPASLGGPGSSPILAGLAEPPLSARSGSVLELPLSTALGLGSDFKSRKRQRDSFGAGLSLSQESSGSQGGGESAAADSAQPRTNSGNDSEAEREPPNKVQRTTTLSEFELGDLGSLSQPGGELPLSLSQGAGGGDGNTSTVSRSSSISQYLS